MLVAPVPNVAMLFVPSPTCTVPAVMTLAPLKVFGALRSNVDEPDLLNPPSPEM